MRNAQLSRVGGLALLVGAVAFGVHVAARSVITAGADPASFARDGAWVPISALGVLGAALVLLGLPALHARIADSTGVSGVLGVALLALAWMFFGIFLSLYGLLVAPWLAEEAPSLVAASAPPAAGILIAFIVGMTVELIGTVLLAVPFIRGRVRPRWVGYALPASALLRVVGGLVAPSGPASDLAINLLSNLGPVLLVVALGYLGFLLWSERAPSRDRVPG
jgi:hypothetical protein